MINFTMIKESVRKLLNIKFLKILKKNFCVNGFRPGYGTKRQPIYRQLKYGQGLWGLIQCKKVMKQNKSVRKLMNATVFL